MSNPAVVWSPYVGEGRRPQGGMNSPRMMGDAQPPVEYLDASNCATDIRSLEEIPECHTSGTHPI